MKRNDFKKIIRLRSRWKITGENYKLPSGEPVSVYIQKLVDSQLEIDQLAVLKNGDLAFSTGGEWNDQAKEFEDYKLMPDYKEDETCDFYEMEKRTRALVHEIVLN
jgi:hypothetical protein|nr:MAG TPA: hypothetical protein [Caudoviricetes sp.]